MLFLNRITCSLHFFFYGFTFLREILLLYWSTLSNCSGLCVKKYQILDTYYSYIAKIIFKIGLYELSVSKPEEMLNKQVYRKK